MRRLALLVPAAILAALVSLAPVAPLVPGCAAAGSNHAALVVEHADGSVVSRCVAFDANQITGEQLLNSSGILWSSQTFGGFGDAVCAIDGEPASYVDCLGKDRYWAVFVARAGGSWQLANEGISTLTLGDGDAEGFRYVPASGIAAAPVSASGACAAAAPTPTATPTLTTTSMATPSATPTRRPALTATTATASPTAGATTAATEPPASGVAPTATATTSAAATTAATTAATPPPQAPIPAPSGGTDLGLLAAAVAGGGLAGLALLRLFAARTRPR